MAVDNNPIAINLAKESGGETIDVVESDVLEYLRGETKLFDCVVVDPPSWGNSQSGVKRALEKYREVYDLAARRVSPGGILLLHCGGRSVTRKQFEKLVRETGSGRRPLLVHEYMGSGLADFPTPLLLPALRPARCAALQFPQ